MNTDPAQFAAYMQYLANEGFTVIAMRDLAQYVDPENVPADLLGVIEFRTGLLEQESKPLPKPKGQVR